MPREPGGLRVDHRGSDIPAVGLPHEKDRIGALLQVIGWRIGNKDPGFGAIVEDFLEPFLALEAYQRNPAHECLARRSGAVDMALDLGIACGPFEVHEDFPGKLLPEFPYICPVMIAKPGLFLFNEEKGGVGDSNWVTRHLRIEPGPRLDPGDSALEAEDTIELCQVNHAAAVKGGCIGRNSRFLDREG